MVAVVWLDPVGTMIGCERGGPAAAGAGVPVVGESVVRVPAAITVGVATVPVRGGMLAP